MIRSQSLTIDLLNIESFQLDLYNSTLFSPLSRSKQYRSLNAIKCRSPPKMYILSLFRVTLCPSRAQGFFPMIKRCDSSYIISCFSSFLLISWFPIDYRVLSIDSVVGEWDRVLLYSLGFSLNCLSNYFFLSINFFCLFSFKIFFITSLFLSFYGETLWSWIRSGLLVGLFLFYCLRVGEHS